MRTLEGFCVCASVCLQAGNRHPGDKDMDPLTIKMKKKKNHVHNKKKSLYVSVTPRLSDLQRPARSHLSFQQRPGSARRLVDRHLTHLCGCR